MSHKSNLLWVVLLLFTLNGNYAYAEPQPPSDSDSAQLLANDTQNTAKIWQPDANLPAKFITIPAQNPVPKSRSLTSNASDEQIARAFLGDYGQIVGVRSQQTELTLLKQERTANADGFVRFQQVYRTIPVLAGELNVHINQQRNVTSVNGEILANINLDTTPIIDNDAASTIARNYIAKQYGVTADTLSIVKSTLWIYNPRLLGGPGTQITTLNWRTEVSGQRGADPIRELVLVNAANGIVTLHFNQIAYALNQRVCNGNDVADTDYDANNNCNTDAKASRLNSATPSGNADVDLAWEYTKATYDYFFQVLGRDSIDNRGMRLISLVRYCPKGEVCPYQNAFWNSTQMTYGPGFAAADDVVAHELTHGITERTAALFYYFQSGAISESMSDVFGELIDLSYAGTSGDAPGVRWSLGEDLAIGAIRSMSAPADFQQPDKMTDTTYYVNYPDANVPSYGNDNGGVHTNSGVNNKATYLMVDGDTFNGQTVTGIGSTKVAQLYYRVLTTYLTSGSDYYDLGVALNTACSDLVALNVASMSSANCEQVAKAVTATEMLTTPTNAPASDAVLCSTGQTPANVWADNFENPTSGNWAAQKPKVVWYNPGSLDKYGNGKYATSGVGNLYGYNLGSTTDSSVNMVRNVTIPAGAFLTFKHSFEFESSNYISPTAVFFDGGVLEYSINNSTTWTDAGALITTNGYKGQVDSSTNVLKTRSAFVGSTSGYISSKVDLSTLAGSPVRFRFRIGTDSTGDNYGWYIDDVRIYKCLSDTTTAKTTAVGSNNSCTLTNAGEAWCWGRNNLGQLGDGTFFESRRAVAVTKAGVTVPVVLNDITAIASGTTHSCARTRDGSAWCWGDNSDWQRGFGEGDELDALNNSVAEQVTIDISNTPLTGVSAVSVGDNASCAIVYGMVACWGDNSEGQLGFPINLYSRFPGIVLTTNSTALGPVTAISVGTHHACAVLSDKSAWCWGDNSDGATGAGSTAANLGAVRVTKAGNAALTNVVAISAGAAHTCALLGDNTVWCWGLNTSGQLGNGSTMTSLVAVPTGLKNIATLGTSVANHTCAISTTNILYCWGANTLGQLGDGTTTAKTKPVTLKSSYAAAVGTITNVSSGNKQTCLSNTMGQVWCWGRNSYGQLGNGINTKSLAPVRVRNTSDVMFGD